MEEIHSENQKSEPDPLSASKIIGLTGGIGSGKTTVAKFIENCGFPVYYSDDRAKEIVNDNDDLKSKITRLAFLTKSLRIVVFLSNKSL